MRPSLDIAGMKAARPWEYALRFLFGGVVTAFAGVVAKSFGPVVGGLFLAFPAILPASLTLVSKHGGRGKAIDDARGGRLGSVGLVGFAATVWLTAEAWPPQLALVAATAVWLVVNGAGWCLIYGRRSK